jgi:hypothetical protein
LYVSVTCRGVALKKPHDFTRFHIETDYTSTALLADALSRYRPGVLNGAYAYVYPAALERLAPADSSTSEWNDRLRQMITYARDHGWTDATGRLRGHCVWPKA